MKVGNAVVSMLLRSPLHRMMSGSTALIRYNGRRSGRQFTTPTQYARSGDDVIILVGRPASKSWWRNFRVERDIDVLLRHRWMPMTARTIVGADEPETIAPLFDAYAERFPKAVASLGAKPGEPRAANAVVVWCRRR